MLWVNNSREGEKSKDFGSTLKAELTRLANELVLAGEEKKRNELLPSHMETSGLASHLEHNTETPTLLLQKQLHPEERSVDYSLLSSALWVLKHCPGWGGGGHCETECKRKGTDESFPLEVYELIGVTG